MESKKSIAPLVVEAERVIRLAIKQFGLSVKPDEIIITIQSNMARGKKSAAYGWFARERWKHKKTVHEINLSAEFLTTDNEVGHTLLHELAHAENCKLGIKDNSGSQCHNKKFKVMAERLGMTIKERHPRLGYGLTTLGPIGEQFLKKIAFKRQLFGIIRREPSVRQKKGSRLIKCECLIPGCGYTVRTTKKWLDIAIPTCPREGHEGAPLEPEELDKE